MPVWKRPGAACPIIDSTVPVNLINLWIVIPPVRRESVGHPWVRSDRLQVQHCRLPRAGNNTSYHHRRCEQKRGEVRDDGAAEETSVGGYQRCTLRNRVEQDGNARTVPSWKPTKSLSNDGVPAIQEGWKVMKKGKKK